MKEGKIYFVTGIDTGIGKTAATAAMLRWLLRRGTDATSMKLVQTGCEGSSEDLLAHRAASGGETADDREGLTAPQIFRFPSSPALAAGLEGREVDVEAVSAAAAELARRHDAVLAEGAGGMLVPLRGALLEADFAAERGWPLLLVTCGRLGSLNHTLLSLEAAKSRGMDVAGVVFDEWPAADPLIEADTKKEILRHLDRLGFERRLASFGRTGADGAPADGAAEPDFSSIFP